MNGSPAYRLLLTTSLLLTAYVNGLCQNTSPFVLVGNQQQATIVLAANEPECVRLAAQDLVSDVQKITGRSLRVVTAVPGQRYQNSVLIGTLGKGTLVQTYLPDSRQLAGKWEAHHIRSAGTNLIVAGSDERGTMFAIYHFIEQYLGVDPLYFWSDREPQKRAELSWSNISVIQNKPTFRYRGWFINDEDLLTEWQEPGGERNIDYPFYKQVVNPKTMRHVLEALVRLRQNLIIPASFIDIRNPAEAALVEEATRRGVFVSMHHVEPMGVSAFTYFNYWKAKDGSKPLFSYYSQRKKVEEVWRVYAREWAKYPTVIWQIGLRGIADRPMWLADPSIPQTDADRGRLISEAMQTQMQIIREVDSRPNPPITTTLWAEGSVLNKSGFLKIPKGVTVVFADNSPGWRMQADFQETPRQSDQSYGVYYHHQLWNSGPHWVQIVPPAQTHKVLQQVVAKGDTAYGIVNVSNLREFVLGVDATARMLTNFRAFQPDVYQQNWFANHYGALATDVGKAYQTYFNGFVLNSRTGTPILMDGQIRSVAINLLRELQLQVTDTVAYRRQVSLKKAETEESRWAKTALADMGSEPLDAATLLARLTVQKAAHQRADSLARQLLPRLSTDSQSFIKTNLLAHLDLILGLEDWLANLIRAKQAADAGKQTEMTVRLNQAVVAFQRMQQGQKQMTESEKWQHWYRGDKKMNLESCKRLTGDILNLAVKDK